ncbi:MAG: hypothetical protein ACRCX2_07580 [Paraclostridium sp.]
MSKSNKLRIKDILPVAGRWYTSLINSIWTLLGVMSCLVEAMWCINNDNRESALISVIMAFCMIIISRGGVLTNDMNPDSLEQTVVITIFPIFGIYTSTAFIAEVPSLLAYVKTAMWAGWLASLVSLIRLADNKMVDHRSVPVLLSYIAVVLLALSILIQ